MNTQTDKTIATEIYNQLGGNHFKAMTGAKNFYATDQSLGFMLPYRLAKDNINFVKITLNLMDTYDIEFKSVRGTIIKDICDVNMVYNDQLIEIIESKTGLNLILR